MILFLRILNYPERVGEKRSYILYKKGKNTI